MLVSPTEVGGRSELLAERPQELPEAGVVRARPGVTARGEGPEESRPVSVLAVEPLRFLAEGDEVLVVAGVVAEDDTEPRSLFDRTEGDAFGVTGGRGMG